MHGFDFAAPLAFLLLPLPALVALWRRGGQSGSGGLRISSSLRDAMGGDLTARQPPSRAIWIRWAAWALLVVAIVLVARSARVPARRGRGAGSSDVSDPLAGTDAREHRRLAARWEAEGRHAEALREWLRAAVATIEERGILPVRPGRTGARTAAEAGPVLPGAAPDLATATAAFDQVWFGGRRATDADVAAAHRAADAVRTERVRVEAGAGPPDGIAAPW